MCEEGGIARSDAVEDGRASAEAKEGRMSFGSIALTIAYDGEPFAGFARQPGLRTVQGRLEEALATALRRDVTTVGAGRTDSGVHALGQVVSFDAEGDERLESLAKSLTALAGPGIVVREARAARPGFSARFDAVSREYRFRLTTGPVPALFLAKFAWHVPAEFDLLATQVAAEHLYGEHDFRSFCVAESAEDKNTVRRIEEIEIYPEEQLGEECLVVRVVGNAFLHSMIRVIVGSLVEVGTGRREPRWLGDALEARDRAAAGPTAPPHGLTFWRVEYPDEVWE
jgi:tRNA pseudouridine38-40 synthase